MRTTSPVASTRPGRPGPCAPARCHGPLLEVGHHQAGELVRVTPARWHPCRRSQPAGDLGYTDWSRRIPVSPVGEMRSAPVRHQ